MTLVDRRRMLAVCTGAAATLIAAPAVAQAWPTRQIRILVPFPAGGSADISARLIAEGLRERLGQTVIVDNRPGAGGNIAAGEAARAEPDGHTLFVGTNGTQAINAFMFRTLTFDPQRDFAPIALVWEAPNVVVVHRDQPSRTLADLVAAARARPESLSFGSSGIGSATHLAGEMFMARAAARLVHVPYRGQAQAITDLLGGQIQVMFPLVPDIRTHVASGAVRALAVAATARTAFLTDVPTTAEAGLPGVVASAWTGLLAPAATPQPVRARLAGAMADLMARPEFRARLVELGVEATPLEAERFGERIAADRALWGDIVTGLRLQLD